MMMLSILYLGGAQVSAGAMTVGQLSSFLVYAIYVGYSMDGLTSFYTELNKGVAAGARLFELADREPAIPTRGSDLFFPLF
jgi:ABC-type multidrug transport system fused ATPase/permease subunit